MLEKQNQIFFLCFLYVMIIFSIVVIYKALQIYISANMAQPYSYQTQHYFASLLKAIRAGNLQELQNILRASAQNIINKLDVQSRQPPLYHAAVNDSDETSCQMFKLLIRYGANYRFKDGNEQTVLFYVCRQGKQKCAQILLSQGLSLDDVDIYGQTAMFYAASENRVEIVRKYATKQRVNHADKLAGQTPLYYAARRGHLELCKLLVQKGADVRLLDSTNKMAIQYAKKGKFMDVAEFLNNQLKRNKDEGIKLNLQSYSLQQSVQRKKKDDHIKMQRQSYKIVFLNQRGEPRDLTEEDVRQLVRQKPELQAYLATPQQIPQELMEMSAAQNWQRIANKILTQCSKSKGAYWFTQPVNPAKYNIIDYFEVITRPMDLGTIRKKLSHHCYIYPRQFVEDMSLIWNNCYKYNGETHDISKCAKELETSFKQYIGTYGFDKFLQNK